MSSGSERNKVCWCGSGKKFKRCHLLLEEADRLRADELEGRMRKKTQRRTCMCPPSMLSECSGSIVSAHTISRSASLNALAVDGHIYAYNVSLSSLHRSGGRIVPERMGVRKVSTFNGFCSYHDTKLFRVLDVVEDHTSPEFLGKMCFRSVSKELFLKRNLQDDEHDIRAAEMGRDVGFQQFIRLFMGAKNVGMQAAVKELEVVKSRFDEMIERGCYDDAVHVVAQLKGKVPVLVSSLFQPERTASGKKIQDISDLSVLAQNVLLTSFPVGENSCVALSFLKDAHLAREFVESVVALGPNEMIGYFIGLAFEVAENLAISPDWWSALSETWRNTLIEAGNRGVLVSQSSETEPLKCTLLPLPTTVDEVIWVNA